MCRQVFEKGGGQVYWEKSSASRTKEGNSVNQNSKILNQGLTPVDPWKR